MEPWLELAGVAADRDWLALGDRIHHAVNSVVSDHEKSSSVFA